MDKVTIQQKLKAGGFNRFYEHKNGQIIVEESDPIRVGISVLNGIVKVDGKFPQIGNPAQIAISLVAWLATQNLILGVVIGQAASYFWYQNKVNKLKGQIEELFLLRF